MDRRQDEQPKERLARPPAGAHLPSALPFGRGELVGENVVLLERAAVDGSLRNLAQSRRRFVELRAEQHRKQIGKGQEQRVEELFEPGVDDVA